MSHVRYIDKTREYYKAEGYDRAYEWAHFDTIPFRPFAELGKPLAQCRVGLVSSGDVVRCDVEPPPDDPRRLVYSLPADLPVDRFQSRKAAYDRYATTLEDVDSFLPLTHLHRLAAEGVLGGVAARHGRSTGRYCFCCWRCSWRWRPRCRCRATSSRPS